MIGIPTDYPAVLDTREESLNVPATLRETRRCNYHVFVRRLQPQPRRAQVTSEQCSEPVKGS